MKLLIISQFFPPDITAAAFRISDTAELLAHAGHDVRVITAVPHKAAASGHCENNSILPAEAIYRCRLHALAGSGLVPYVRHYLSFVRGSVAAALRLRTTGWRPDVVWASSPPLFTGITGYASACIFRRPWVLDVRDLWPESAVAAGQLREEGRAFRIGKWLESFLYNHARSITCVSSPMREYISRMTKTPVGVVYNGVKESSIAASGVRTPGTNRQRRVLLYAGNLGRVQALDTLITTVAGLHRAAHLRDWEVRLVGDGALRKELAELIQKSCLEDRVQIRPPIARSEVDREVSEADALFLSLTSHSALRMTIPSKLFDYLATNKPIIAGISGEGAEIASRTGGNVVYEPDSRDGLASALLHLGANLEQLTARARDNGSIVREAFTREKAVAVLDRVLTLAAHGARG